MDKLKIESTVLFFDRRNFYMDSKGKDAVRLAEELDSFYMGIIDSASAHKGRVIKFMGDAGLLVFESVDDAVRFARELFESKGYRSNVGIEQGEIVLGTFGKQPLQWTDVVGEAVNEAAKNMHRSGKTDKIVLGPQAWQALGLEERDDLALSQEL